MANNPAFASTPKAASALLGSAETNLQVPTTASNIFNAGGSGSKIEEIVVKATTTSLVATTVAGLVYIFLFDGTTHHLFDDIPVTAVTPSATTAPFRANKVYTNLWLPSGWSLRASQSIAGNASILKFTALYEDL